MKPGEREQKFLVLGLLIDTLKVFLSWMSKGASDFHAAVQNESKSVGVRLWVCMSVYA